MGRHDSHFDASTSLSMDWMVAQIRPGQTDRAITNLRRQSFDVFCPMERRPTGGSIPKRSKPVSPLFPGYIFVKSRVDASPWQKINSTYGVSRLLMSPDGTPSNVRSDIMNGIIMSTDEDGVLLEADHLVAQTDVDSLLGRDEVAQGLLELRLVEEEQVGPAVGAAHVQRRARNFSYSSQGLFD